MSIAFAGSLAVLALLDSTSIGTLFVPIVLMLTPGRLRVLPLLGYLATIAGFYFAIGVAIAVGAGSLLDDLDALLDGDRGYWLELAFGVGLFVLSSGSTPNVAGRKGTGPRRCTGPPAHPAR